MKEKNSAAQKEDSNQHVQEEHDDIIDSPDKTGKIETKRAVIMR